MKYNEAPDKYVLNVGDTILRKGPLDNGFKAYVVSRVTPKFAFIKYNDVAEAKFPRTYSRFHFKSLPEGKWCTTQFKVGIPIPPIPAIP